MTDTPYIPERSALFPVLAPSRVSGKPSPLSVGWLPRAMHTPLLFSALMWGSSLHLDIVANRPHLDDVERIFHKAKTIRLLNEDLCDPSKSLGDDQLMAMFVLATHDSFEPQEIVPDIFKAALDNVRWLKVYWRMSVSNIHFQALFTAVAIRGGLETIEFVGLAEIIS
jgi:hypothetical protein